MIVIIMPVKLQQRRTLYNYTCMIKSQSTYMYINFHTYNIQVILYLVHVNIIIKITSDRNKIWAWDLQHSTALIEVVKSLVPSVKGHAEVPYQKPRLKSMASAMYQHNARYQLNMNGVQSQEPVIFFYHAIVNVHVVA